MLRYKRINSQFFTDTFSVTSKAKSTRGNTCSQLFVSYKGFITVYNMKSKADFKHALQLFCKEVEVPIDLVVDPSKEQTSNAVKQFYHRFGTNLQMLV